MLPLATLVQPSAPTSFKHELVLSAPVSGELVSLQDLPDPLIQAGLWGEGIAIRTRNTECISPITAKVSKLDIADQRWTLVSKNGLQLGVQIGPVTKPLYGERLKVLVRENQSVKRTQTLCQLDPLFLTQQWGYCYCILTVMNRKGIKAIVLEPPSTKVTTENPIIRIYL